MSMFQTIIPLFQCKNTNTTSILCKSNQQNPQVHKGNKQITISLFFIYILKSYTFFVRNQQIQYVKSPKSQQGQKIQSQVYRLLYNYIIRYTFQFFYKSLSRGY
ncbi:hypothetical protein pb186bvf_011899 [Paramecium bursaria]